MGEELLNKMNNDNKKIINVFKILVILVIFISGYVSPLVLWNLTDYFIAILAIINISSLLRIND